MNKIVYFRKVGFKIKNNDAKRILQSKSNRIDDFSIYNTIEDMKKIQRTFQKSQISNSIKPAASPI